MIHVHQLLKVDLNNSRHGCFGSLLGRIGLSPLTQCFQQLLRSPYSPDAPYVIDFYSDTGIFWNDSVAFMTGRRQPWSCSYLEMNLCRSQNPPGRADDGSRGGYSPAEVLLPLGLPVDFLDLHGLRLGAPPATSRRKPASSAKRRGAAGPPGPPQLWQSRGARAVICSVRGNAEARQG